MSYLQDIDHPLTAEIRALRYACGCRVIAPDTYTVDQHMIDNIALMRDKAKRKCTICFKNDYIARKKAAVAAKKSLRLKPLTSGTPKQKKFADVIRTEMHTAAVDPIERQKIIGWNEKICGLDAEKWIKCREQIEREIERALKKVDV
jgi:hypothetical protein